MTDDKWEMVNRFAISDLSFAIFHLRLYWRNSVNRINNFRHCYKPLSARIEAFFRREPLDPFNRRQTTPLPFRIFVTAYYLGVRAVEASRNEVVERTINVTQRGASASAVESDFNVCFAADVEVPATTQIDDCAIASLDC